MEGIGHRGLVSAAKDVELCNVCSSQESSQATGLPNVVEAPRGQHCSRASSKRIRDSTYLIGSGKRPRHEVPPSRPADDSSLASDCSLGRLDRLESATSTQGCFPPTALLRAASHPPALALSPTCSERELSAAGSNNNDSAQSPRRPTPAPVTSALSPRPPAPPAPAPIRRTGTFCPELLRLLGQLQKSEAKAAIVPDFLASRHPGVDPSMRRLVTSWLVEVAAEFDLSQHSLHLAVSTLDRFLSKARGVPRGQLQLIAVAALLVAAKHEEEAHPSAADLSAMAAHSFTPTDLVRAEALLLSVLRFALAPPTPFTFLSVLRGLLDLSPETHALAAFYLELGILEYDLVGVAPSALAAAAVALAAGRRREVGVLADLKELLPGAAAAAGPAARVLKTAAEAAAHGDAGGQYTPYTPIRDKYAAEKWHCVALMPGSA